MKKIQEKKLVALAVVAVVLACLAFFIYIVPNDSFNRVKVYTESQGNFSFQVPDSLNIEREQIADDEIFLKITAPNDRSSANPGLASITVFRANKDLALLDHASAFLSVDKNKFVSIPSARGGYYYAAQNGQEGVYYYFFENTDNIIVFKFNKSYFDKSNPMMLIDNSPYANIFLRTLNSLKFV